MAMITQLPNGTLLTAWQAADHVEGTSDQHLVMAASLDGSCVMHCASTPSIKARVDALKEAGIAALYFRTMQRTDVLNTTVSAAETGMEWGVPQRLDV
eukprot:scaffold117943_cov47-Prasinocladus_malaysianus.AAC.1